MAFALDSRKLAAVSIAVLITGLLVFFGTGLHPFWPLLWLAPLPVLLAAPRLRGFAAFGTAALAWFLGSFTMWRYLHTILGPAPGAIAIGLAIMAIPAVAFGLSVLLSRRFMIRSQPVMAALALPAAWVSYEYLTAAGSPHSTFGNLAYTQMNFLPLLQLAAVTGVWGITFVLFLLPSSAAVLLLHIGTAKRRLTLAAGVGILFTAVLVFGFLRLHAPYPSSTTCIRIGLVASDLPQNVYPNEPAGRLFHDYAEQAASLGRQGAQVIVLPEKLGVAVDPATRVDPDATFQAVANHNRTDIVLGLIRVAPPVKYNEARIYSPEGGSALTYDKHHMLPEFESKLRPGTTETLLQKPSGLWGVAICKDMDFPELSRDYGAKGVSLLLVPAWDFVDDAWLHDRMAIMRGVESGFTIARAAKEGLLTVSDDRGRVLAERSSSAAPFATVIVRVPLTHARTPYLLLGDWFAWLAATLLVSMLLLMMKSVIGDRSDGSQFSVLRGSQL